MVWQFGQCWPAARQPQFGQRLPVNFASIGISSRGYTEYVALAGQEAPPPAAATLRLWARCIARLGRRGWRCLRDDLVADHNAFVADGNTVWPSNEPPHLLLTLATK
jgi:hypothetical protein